ncbi:MAG: hypothetical protein QE290_18475 [Acidovorax sp.]|uniref:hypothetical protein n=1 Tax=Acidovorax sp. TaxID=1872122 RepID=UPI00261AD581|nr:hypothetical protein [Acidovorax sp.]MDH4466020.1 hypothetical protein [Acidovorax sp.]
MIKDSIQKQKAVRYCVAHGYVPFMECLIRYSADTSDKAADITDVDVLGVRPAAEMNARRLVFDCKTLAKTSAVGRALWAAGLLQLLKADEAFVILLKPAPEGHRLAARQINVHLFAEKLFDEHGRASSADYLDGITYLDNLEAWDALWALRLKYPRMSPLIEYLSSDAAFERDPAVGFRMLLARLKLAEGEFDVSKPEHRLLYGVVVSQAMVFLSSLVHEFNAVFDAGMKLEVFQASLRNYVWGGREGVELRKRLQVALQAGRKEEIHEFQLPGWDMFVEVTRSLLDAPLLSGAAALPVKDLAFKEVALPSALADKRIKFELTGNARARQYALLVNRYVGSLSRLLKDCSDHLAGALAKATI